MQQTWKLTLNTDNPEIAKQVGRSLTLISLRLPTSGSRLQIVPGKPKTTCKTQKQK